VVCGSECNHLRSNNLRTIATKARHGWRSAVLFATQPPEQRASDGSRLVPYGHTAHGRIDCSCWEASK
jgi:hypothetical protein